MDLGNNHRHSFTRTGWLVGGEAHRSYHVNGKFTEFQEAWNGQWGSPFSTFEQFELFTLTIV